MSGELTRLTRLTLEMARSGTRRLLVLCGEDEWIQVRLNELSDVAAGEWLWVGTAPAQRFKDSALPPATLKTLLGREFLHAVFDARQGLDARALAILVGSLKAGSWLALLAPPLTQWPQRPDADSVRWSDCPDPIATPHFIHHLQTCLDKDKQVVTWCQTRRLMIRDAQCGATWHPADGRPQASQAAVLNILLTMDRGVAALVAGRGRGKSALAGMLIKRLDVPVCVTAPAKAASDVLADFAGNKFQFYAPDRLLELLAGGNRPNSEWLIVDEAAAIPGPQLKTLIAAWPRVLLITTVQGYEGTGRGFLLKLCAGMSRLKTLTLDAPMRWARDCPLERIIEEILAFNDAPATGVCGAIRPPQRVDVRDAYHVLPVYRLLCSAHYRTSPDDLRRLLDAPGQYLWKIVADNLPAAALWAVCEGGLSASLSRAIWAGSRRPRGNLVAQSLAAHGGSPLSATLRGVRISRVAVMPECQRTGLGSKLVAAAMADVKYVDYLSVSFGYTGELWRFWQRAGFVLVRIGTHREASSGCFNAMALRAISPAGQRLVQHESRRLARTLPWILPYTDIAMPIDIENSSLLDNEDWLELAGFAWGLRPLASCLGSLNRLLLAIDKPCLPLREGLTPESDRSKLCRKLGLSGRKALLVAQRECCGQALQEMDDKRAAALRLQIVQWKSGDEYAKNDLAHAK